MKNKISHKKALLCSSLLNVLSKVTAHESRRIPVSKLKDFEQITDTKKGKNPLTRIILGIKPSQKQ